MRLLVVYLHHHFSAKFKITLNLRVMSYSSDQLCSGIVLLPPPGQPGPHRPSTSSTKWRPGWKGTNLHFKFNGIQQTTQKPSPYHHIINTRHPRLHKHPNSSSDLLSNSQTAGLVTLNTMTLMPLLLAGAAFAKVSFGTSNFYGLSLTIVQKGSRSIYPLYSLPRVT